MTHKPAQGSFGWWLTPTQRAHRSTAPTTIAPPQRGPFSKPNAGLPPGSDSALKTAQILPFTGSNTPYESHE